LRAGVYQEDILGYEPAMQLIWAIVVILVVFWLLGFLLHFGGGLIHLLLVIALILLVFNLLTGRGAKI
jgi:hypothetical protein